jgi:hypothetical protein
VKQGLTCVIGAVAALAVSSAAPAGAEPLRVAQAFERQGFGPEVLPPYEVVTIVRSAGLDPLTRPFLRGRNYVIRAIDRNDHEVRVVVDARHGEIRRVVPVAVASRGLTMGPYERMDGARVPPPGRYVEPGDDGEPPSVVYGDEPMEADAPRPPAAVPGVSAARAIPAPVIRSAPVRGAELHPLPEPRVITADPGRAGLLPPPPGRFQPSTATPAKPKPVKRNVAAIPRNAPLPKPRPQAHGEPRTGESTASNASAPAASAPPAPQAQPSTSGVAAEKTPVPTGNSGATSAPAPAENAPPAAPAGPAAELPN